MKFKVNKFNYKLLPRSIKALMKFRSGKVEIELFKNKKNLPYFIDMSSFLYKILDYEINFEILLKDFPYCVLNENSRDHILTTGFKGEKIEKCKDCRYFEQCSGFPVGYFKKYGDKEVCPIKDLPVELVIEVEPRCNFNCRFCFNKISFAHNGRNLRPFTTKYVKKIIDNVKNSNIRTVRFTGGEPLLYKDIFELLKYSKDKDLEVRLNTNASLINSNNVKKFKDIVDNILIPIESWDNKNESIITGFANALERKISAIKLLKKLGIKIVRVGTVATKENILNFSRIAELILELPVDEWELYRPMSINKEVNEINKEDIGLLVDKIIDLRKRTDKHILLANALPFCVIDNPNKLNAISCGALYDDGHNRLVVDPRNFIKPHYFINENLGSPTDILSAWNHQFVKKMRNLEFLPKECSDCSFKFKCRGGSRYEAKLVSGNYSSLDPLIKK